MKHLPKKALALAFMTIIAIITIANIRLAWNVIREPSKKRSFTKRISQIQKSYPENIKWRTHFVEINGGFCRLAGIIECNRVIRLNNGMVVRTAIASKPNPHITEAANRITDFAKKLESINIPFLYVNCPDKMDPDGTLLPTGITFYSNSDTDFLLNTFAKNNIHSLDLRPIVAKTGIDIKQHYYATDHHWNAYGALKATPAVIRAIAELLEFDAGDLGQFNLNKWEVIPRKKWWLGSEGKRTGRFFSGLDDLDILIPKFETNISIATPSKQEFRKGPFKDAIIQHSFLNQRPHFYKTSGYYVFGWDRPLIHYRNELAPQKKKILIVKDSFGVPLSNYLSTFFSEIDIVDIRGPHYKESSLITLVERLQPDIVVITCNPSSRREIAEKLENSITNQWTTTTLVYETNQIELTRSSTNKYQYRQLPITLKNGATYVIRIDNVELLGGKTQGTAIGLFNPKANVAHSRTLFDFEYANKHGGWQWEVKVPEKGDWKFILYAGIAGQTQNISMRYNQIKISQRIK